MWHLCTAGRHYFIFFIPQRILRNQSRNFFYDTGDLNYDVLGKVLAYLRLPEALDFWKHGSRMEIESPEDVSRRY